MQYLFLRLLAFTVLNTICWC